MAKKKVINMNLTSEQIATAELEAIKYQYVWEHCDTYGDKHHDLDLFNRFIGADRLDIILGLYHSIIVLGCGDGSLVRHLDYLEYKTMGVDIYPHPFWQRPFERTGGRSTDITRCMFRKQSLWDDLPRLQVENKWDSFVCADVLEHIPEILLDNVLTNIRDHCKSGIFQVADMESKFGGYDLHLIKEDAGWWLDRIQGAMGGTVTLVDDPGAPRSRFVIYWNEL